MADGTGVGEQVILGEIIEGETHDYLMSTSPTGGFVIWEYIFEDLKRDTALKISADDRYFQFIAPEIEFSIKEAAKW